jgi:hypothetical protein
VTAESRSALMRAWRRLTWRHWIWATAIGLAVTLSIPLQKFEVNLYWAPWRVIFGAPWMLLFAYVFLLAIVVAESYSPPASRVSTRRYVVAALAASVVCLGLVAAFSDYVRMPPREEFRGQVEKKVGTPEVRQKLYAILSLGLCDGVLHGWLATFIYVRLRNARLAARALAEIQLRQAEANRQLLASQLTSMDAEVDPDAVLSTLEDIQRDYETDSVGANARMDQLIAFLRAAIPRLRTAEPVEVS